MSTRKAFLAASASSALMAAAPAPPAPSASPSPSASPKISPLSREFAERMRAFDPDLSAKQLETIAAGIDDNLETGKRINPGGKMLKNADEPVTIFEVRE
jgi:hypothetical protein